MIVMLSSKFGQEYAIQIQRSMIRWGTFQYQGRNMLPPVTCILIILNCRVLTRDFTEDHYDKYTCVTATQPVVTSSNTRYYSWWNISCAFKPGENVFVLPTVQWINSRFVALNDQYCISFSVFVIYLTAMMLINGGRHCMQRFIK